MIYVIYYGFNKEITDNEMIKWDFLSLTMGINV